MEDGSWMEVVKELPLVIPEDPPRGPSLVGVKKVRYTHQAMIDLIIANPAISQGEIARHFGYTQGWVCQILSSDAVKEMLAARKRELTDPALVAAIEEKFEALARRSMDVLLEKLDLPNASADVALKALDITAKALGYGASKQSIAVNTQFVVAMPAKAENTDAWVSSHSPRVIDASAAAD